MLCHYLHKKKKEKKMKKQQKWKKVKVQAKWTMYVVMVFATLLREATMYVKWSINAH